MQAAKGAPSLLSILAFIAAGSACWHVWSSEVDISPILPDAAPIPSDNRAQPAPAPVALLASLETFSETLARPLFNPTRRPLQTVIEPQPVAEEAPPAPPEGIRVLGVVRAADRPPRALIASPEDPMGRWLQIGEATAGWSIIDIGEAEVTITADLRKQRLSLYGEAPAATTPSPARATKSARRRELR